MSGQSSRLKKLRLWTVVYRTPMKKSGKRSRAGEPGSSSRAVVEPPLAMSRPIGANIPTTAPITAPTANPSATPTTAAALSWATPPIAAATVAEPSVAAVPGDPAVLSVVAVPPRPLQTSDALATLACSPCDPPTTLEEASESDFPHLCCTICLSFPEKEVLQCYNGHILCHACFDRVSREEQPKCPTCRESLDLMRPIRNVLAEQARVFH